MQPNAKRAAFPPFPERFDVRVRQTLLVAKTGKFIVKYIAGGERMGNPQFYTYIFTPNSVFEREVVVREECSVWSVDISNEGHLIVPTQSDVACHG